jgi:hypothetical protein
MLRVRLINIALWKSAGTGKSDQRKLITAPNLGYLTVFFDSAYVWLQGVPHE